MCSRRLVATVVAGLAFLGGSAAPAEASDPFTAVAEKVNQRMVKLFGSGGFRGLVSYGTGVIVSPEGHILTIASQMLDTSEVIVHLSDGRRMRAAVVVTEPELDVALLRIKIEGKEPDEPSGLDLPYFDIATAAKRPPATVGDWVLAFSNEFEIAMRDEPVSVVRGVIAAYSKLHGRRGIFDFPYTGDVYVVDAVTNNPGSGGGALTDRSGNLIGIIGRELKNSLSETWINYAIPIGARVEVKIDGKDTFISIPEFVEKAKKGQYKPVPRREVATGPGGYLGVRFLPNVVGRTPAYVEEVAHGSPAEKAGLQVNDLISFFDGEPVDSIRTFEEYMKRTRPGSVVRLEVRRGDTLQSIEVKLDEHPKGPTPTGPTRTDRK